MNKIKMDELDLCYFDKNNKSHVLFLKQVLSDDSITKRFSGFLPNLMKKNQNSIYGMGFLVEDNEKLIGYVDIGNYNKEEKCVYIRQAVDKNIRAKSYGKRILLEFTNFIFSNYPEVEKIKAKIHEDNIVSIKMAEACGFENSYNDFYELKNPFIKIKR